MGVATRLMSFGSAETRRTREGVIVLGERLVIQVLIDYRSAASVGELRRAFAGMQASAPRPIDFAVLISSQPKLLELAAELGVVGREVDASELIQPWGIANVRRHLVESAEVLLDPALDVEWRIAHLGVLAAGEI